MPLRPAATALPALLCLGLAAQARPGLRPEHQRAVEELQPRIDAAIDRGVAWLLEEQQRDGSWSGDEGHYPSGQTALASYTLMKCGLAPEHAAVQRALESITSIRPGLVYSTGCQLLALQLAGRAVDRPVIERLVDSLLEWRQGSWGYPNTDGRLAGLHNDRDLSITQFALLGLRAGKLAGVKLPRAAMVDALDTVLGYRTRPERGEDDATGFRYRWSAGGKATGSMTTAGVGALLLGRDCLDGRVPRELDRDVGDAIERGVAWLEKHYSVETNPEQGGWLYYYLYGLERVGSLFGTEYLGEHPWYLDGARVLVDKQNADGHWRSDREQADTCFALLFLKRATMPTTGRKLRQPSMTVVEPEGAPVWFRTRGGVDGTPLQVWLTHVGKPDAAPPHVARVRYLIDGEEMATVEGDPSRRWQHEGYLATRAFDRRGTHRLQAEVVTTWPGAGDGEATEHTLRSAEVSITIDHLLEGWMLEAARVGAENLLADRPPQMLASSYEGEHRPGRAVDGRESSFWLCEAADPAPWIELDPSRPVRCRRIALGQAGAMRRQRGEFDAITRVAISIQGQREPLLADLHPDPHATTVIDLGRTMSIRALRIEVLARTPGRQSGRCGFTEIALLE